MNFFELPTGKMHFHTFSCYINGISVMMNLWSFWLRLRSTTHHEIGSWSVGQQPRWWTCCWNTSEKKANPLKLEVTKRSLSYWRWILHGTGILFKSFLPILPSLPLEGSFEASKLIRVSLLEVAMPSFQAAWSSQALGPSGWKGIETSLKENRRIDLPHPFTKSRGTID